MSAPFHTYLCGRLAAEWLILMRNIKLLNTGWKYVKHADDAVSAANMPGETITLPHTWNAVDGQDGGDDYHRGTCWYVLELGSPVLRESQEAWLQFDGVAMTAKVFLNGNLLGHHAGGYSTFRVKLPEDMPEKNTLVISVDNGSNDTVYPQKADFTFYGGIYREVKLITVPKAHFALGYWGSTGLKITPEVVSSDALVTLTAYTENADGQTVCFAVPGVGEICAAVANGTAQAVVHIENVHLWNGVEDPYLYTVTATLDSGDQVSSRFGCRSFRADPQEGFILNGKPYPLRGASRHQDRKGLGSALSFQEHWEDMEILLEMGANTVRLAHYQHAQEFYDLCDEKGILVWAEIPYITMHMKNGRENTLTQMRELVIQNYNHPSIICWGLSNEITAASAVNEDLLENHRLLNDLCHRLDSTRPTTMANVFMLEIDSPILEIPDINSYNLYFGWYLGELEQTDEFFDTYHAKYPDRAIGFSEYGADANLAFQSASPEKGDYTETYQCVYHEHMLKMIEARPWLWATHLWNLFDFAADGRDEGGKHGENQKGLVTFDRKLKKDAFYAYKAYWNKNKPFVHLCGSRYVDRAEKVTEVKAYSNQKEVSFYVDGKLFATVEGAYVFTAELPITGIHTVEARCGKLSSSISIHKVDAPNPAYSMPSRKEVTNWFDDPIDPNFFSVADTLGALRAHPQAGAIVNEMMAKGAASRGEVATAVQDNPALQRMLSRITMMNLMKQAEMDLQTIQQVNRILQTIPKN